MVVPEDARRRDGAGGSGGRTVWLVGLFFGAGPSPTGVLLESLAVALTSQGYKVEAVTGRAVYGTGPANAPTRFRGRVFRLFSGPTRATGLAGRLGTWASFYAAVLLFAFTRRLPDTVILTTTPPLLHAAFAFRRLVTRARCALVLWNQDTYPEILAAVGVLRRAGFPYRVLAAVEHWAARRVDRAVALDRAMADILTSHGCATVRVIPNWDAHRDEITSSHTPDDLDQVLAEARRRYRYVVLYSGNYGWGHDLRPLLAWIRANPEQRDFFLLIGGGGEKWGELVAARDELGGDRVWVGAFLPRARFARLLTQIDFGLVSLEDGCAGLMSPSKVHAYLAAGKPLLYLGPRGSNVDEAIEFYGCGVRAGYDDPGAVAAALAGLAGPADGYARMSAGAVRAAAERHTEEAAGAAFGRLLDELSAARSGRHVSPSPAPVRTTG